MASDLSLSDLLETFNVSWSSAVSLCLKRGVSTSAVVGFIFIYGVAFLATLVGTALLLVAAVASRRLRTRSMAVASLLCLLLLVYQSIMTPLIVWHVESRGALLATNPTVCRIFGFSRLLLDLGCLFTLLILALESLSGVSQPLKHKVTFTKLFPQVAILWLYALSLALVSLNASNGRNYIQRCSNTGLCGLDLTKHDGLVIVFISVLGASCLLFIGTSGGILYFVYQLRLLSKNKRKFEDGFFFNQSAAGDLPVILQSGTSSQSLDNGDIISKYTFWHSPKLDFSLQELRQHAISTVVSLAVFCCCLLPIYLVSAVDHDSDTWLRVNATCNVSCDPVMSGDNLLLPDAYYSPVDSSRLDESVLCEKMTDYGVSASFQTLSFFFMLLTVLPAAVIPFILGFSNPALAAFYISIWHVYKKPKQRVEEQQQNFSNQ